MCSARPVVPAACIFFRRRATGAASARPSLRHRFPERAVLQQSSDANCAARPMTRICAWQVVPRRRRRSCRGKNALVLPDRIELSTSPLPRECSTTELRQQRDWRGPARKPRPNAGGSCHKVPACASAARLVFRERRPRDASKGSERPSNRSEIARSRRILAVCRSRCPTGRSRGGNSPSGQATAGRAEPSVCVANASWLSHLRPQLCLWYGVTGGRDDG